MKKTMTMVVFLLTLGSQAIAGGLSELKLRTNANFPLKVIIDGQIVSQNTTMVAIKFISHGNHSIQVFKVLKSYNSYNEEPLFFGEVYLPQNTVTHALIKHHKFVIEEQFALSNKPSYNRPHHNNSSHQPVYGAYHETKPVNWSTQQYNTGPTCGITGPVYHQEPIHEYVPTPVVEVFPMNSQDFNILKATIENQWFSDGKKVILKQALRDGHMLKTGQVMQLIELFSFSGDRLEVAKLGYLNTVDREQYFRVYENLHWDSSVRNLSNYIASL